MINMHRALLLLAVHAHLPCEALMFHSTNVSKQWDTWAFVENGTYFAYYLITEASPGEDSGNTPEKKTTIEGHHKGEETSRVQLQRRGEVNGKRSKNPPR